MAEPSSVPSAIVFQYLSPVASDGAVGRRGGTRLVGWISEGTAAALTVVVCHDPRAQPAARQARRR